MAYWSSHISSDIQWKWPDEGDVPVITVTGTAPKDLQPGAIGGRQAADGTVRSGSPDNGKWVENK